MPPLLTRRSCWCCAVDCRGACGSCCKAWEVESGRRELHPHRRRRGPHGPALVGQWEVVRRHRALYSALSYGSRWRAAKAHTRHSVISLLMVRPWSEVSEKAPRCAPEAFGCVCALAAGAATTGDASCRGVACLSAWRIVSCRPTTSALSWVMVDPDHHLSNSGRCPSPMIAGLLVGCKTPHLALCAGGARSVPCPETAAYPKEYVLHSRSLRCSCSTTAAADIPSTLK